MRHQKKPTKQTNYSAFPRSKEASESSRQVYDSVQTRSPTYRLAFDDLDFLLKDEQRAVRLQLEWLKPDQVLNEQSIDATWVIFGSARIRERQALESELNDLKSLTDESSTSRRAQLESLRNKCHHYDESVKLASMLSIPSNTGVTATVISGGGPGIMEAANKGAHLSQSKSIGLNIILPTEQKPNPYVSPDLCFQFHYFAIRKMHFLARAKALFAFPGGFGTLDEVLETLTLMQTKRIKRFPVILFGRSFWEKIINFEALAEEGVISHKDLSLFQFVDSTEEAIEAVKLFYQS